MLLKRHALICIGLFLISGFLNGQLLISFSNPGPINGLQVCDSARFEVMLQNNNADTVKSLTLQIDFPQGMSYNLGSMVNGQEADVSNLQSPLFALEVLAPGQSGTYAFWASAACELVDAINSGALFANNIAANYEGGSNSLITDNYLIETPLLVITNSTNLSLSGQPGDMVTRSFTVRNTRLGSLSNLQLRDEHSGGMIIRSPQGTDISTDPNIFELRLTGTDFMAIGDGDALFELDESITIIEEIEITDCGFPPENNLSNVTALWGCNAAICQETTPVEASITYFPNPAAPNLEFRPDLQLPECFCGPIENRQGMFIENTGDDVALDIMLRLRQRTPGGGIDPSGVLMDSSGVISSPLAVGDTLLNTIPECNSPDNLFKVIDVEIPQLGIGETVYLSWPVYHCSFDCSNSEFIQNWGYDYAFSKTCPPDQTTEAFFLSVRDTIDLRTLSFLNDVDTLMGLPLETYTYQVSSPFLMAPMGTLNIQFEIPCIYGWADNPLVLGGQGPNSVAVEENDSTVIIEVEYSLPFPDSLLTMDYDLSVLCTESCTEVFCQSSLLTSCPEPCGPPPEQLFFNMITQLNPDDDCLEGCGLTSCQPVPYNYPCDKENCQDTIPGYVLFDYDLFRTNFGLPDNDDDRLADASGVINPSLVRRDRAIPGDTIRSTVSGIVVGDVPGVTFKNGFVDIAFIPDGPLGAPGNFRLLTAQGMRPIKADLRIYDQSSNQYYDCPNVVPSIPFTLPLSVQYIARYDLSPEVLNANGYSIPADLLYENGDSIFLTSDYRIDYNLQNEDTTSNLPGRLMVQVEPDIYLSNDPNLPRTELYSCNCSADILDISGYNLSILPGVYPVPPCDTSEYSSGSFISLQLAEGNFFPFEHRSIGQLGQWEIALPPTFSLHSSRLAFLQLQDQIDLLFNDPLPASFNGLEWQFDTRKYFETPLDEGFTLLIQYSFEADCKLSGNFPIQTYAHMENVNTGPGPTDFVEFEENEVGLRLLVPNVLMSAPLSSNTSFDNKGRWNFDLFNRPTMIASAESDTAFNCWLYMTSPNGLLDDFELFDRLTGQPIPAINGIFQLGDLLPNDSFYLQSIVQNNSCAEEALEVNYGWDCDPYLNTITVPCSDRSNTFTVISPPAELEQLVFSPVSPHPLCDTVDYHTIEFFNAEQGTAYELIVEAQLPPGMEIVPGSSQLAYPTGSTFFDIGEPTNIGGNLWQWPLSVLNDSIQANGFPGINSAPDNSAQLRFRTTTNCDFISGAAIIFLVAGQQNCNTPTNTLAEAGDPVDVVDVFAPYNASISLSQAEAIGCSDEVLVNVQFVASATTTAADSLQISLPSGVNYQIGSFQAGQNMTNTPPVIIQDPGQQVLKWKLPEGVTAGLPIAFQISLTGFEALDCGSNLMQARAVAPANALCAADGLSCSILVETGSSFLNLNIQRPEYDLTSLSLSAVENGNGFTIDYILEGNNQGFSSEPPTIIDFYADLDGSQSLSSGDELLHFVNYTTILNEGDIFSLSGQFDVSADQLCSIMALIDPASNCACQTDLIVPNVPIQLPQIAENICPGDSLTLGPAAVPGHIYQWTPDLYLSCSDCANAQFSFDNLGETDSLFYYTLTEDRGAGCIFEQTYEVRVPPRLRLLGEEEAICFGDELTLSTVTAATYFWQGEGITNPTSATQMVSPSTSSFYTVQLTDDDGCIATDSLFVEVNPQPIAEAGTDTTYCDNSTAQLQADFDPANDYEWSPANALSNPMIYNPTIANGQSGWYVLTVTNAFSCTAIDSVNVAFSVPPVLSLSGGSSICPGEFATLEASGAATYNWSPATGLDCTTCPIVQASPSEDTWYVVTGTDALGCSSVDSVLVSISGALLATDALSICEGESTSIFGNTISEAGLYCDTTITAAGCDSIICIDLSLVGAVNTESQLSLCIGDTVEIAGELYTEAGFYCDTLIAFNGCDSIHCVLVEEVDLPMPIVEESYTILQGQSVQLDLPDGFDYLWSPETGLSCSDCAKPIASPTEDISYEVTVIDENGCLADIRVSITVEIPICEPPHIFIPTAFTPNDDGENDFIQVFGNPIDELYLAIYNRWGQKVFETRDVDGRWDGTFEGQKLNTDVFGYYLEVLCIDGQEYFAKGNITLIR
ncbi:MAG: gliding motility-associated C-terminal domain-containing protein [Bacteroidota bacterium]